MDDLNSFATVSFSLTQIEQVLSVNRDLALSKKGRELVLCYHWVMTLIDESEHWNDPRLIKSDVRLGFPINPKSVEHKFSLQEILESRKIVIDEDVDVVLSLTSDKAELPYRIQVTRLYNYQRRDQKIDDLLKLIEKKSSVQADPNVWLVIGVEEKLKFDIKELVKALQTMNIPFGAIYLCGLLSEKEHYHFSYYRILPDFAHYSRIVSFADGVVC